MTSLLLLSFSLFIRFPHLLGFGVLTPEYAASKVVDAIENNQTILIMPRGAYFSTALQQYVQPFDPQINNLLQIYMSYNFVVVQVFSLAEIFKSLLVVRTLYGNDVNFQIKEKLN